MRSQRGQALAFLLMVMAALLGGLLFVFDSGQLIAAKVRLLGAADAAAYSAASWQARSLNFQGYMNRAVVANEVAIAQWVSLQAWSAYLDQALQKAATVSSVVPPLGSAMRSVQQGWSAADRTLQRSLPLLESAASRWNVVVLANADHIAATAAPAVADDLALQVAARNVAEAGQGAGGQALRTLDRARWLGQTISSAQRADGRSRLKQVVMDSRDGFTRSRGWTLGVPLLQLRKRGGTDLIGYEGWRGMDTLALREPVLFGSPERPLAWGADENRHAALPGRGDHGGSYRDNPRTAARAARAVRSASGYLGLPVYRDLGAAALRGNGELRYELELRQPGVSVATSRNALGGAATVVPGEAPKDFAPAYDQGYLHALSAAHVQFIRPEARADGREELPSLFNPYWQARLAPVSSRQRLMATAARGSSDPYLVLP